MIEGVSIARGEVRPSPDTRAVLIDALRAALATRVLALFNELTVNIAAHDARTKFRNGLEVMSHLYELAFQIACEFTEDRYHGD